jgi:hypothetical protein
MKLRIFTCVSQCLRVYPVPRQGICLMESLRDLCAFFTYKIIQNQNAIAINLTEDHFKQ